MFLDGPFQCAHMKYVCSRTEQIKNQLKMKYVFIAFCLKSTMKEQTTIHTENEGKKHTHFLHSHQQRLQPNTF